MSRKLRLDILLEDDEVDTIARTLGKTGDDTTNDEILDWMTQELQYTLDRLIEDDDESDVEG